MNSFYLGIIAEYFIILIYKISLYKLIAHRMRNYCGEIDIIMKRGNLLVFIEVKARRRPIYDSIITNKQKLRIYKSINLFLAQNIQYKHCNVRIDLAIVMPYKIPIIIKNICLK